MRVCVCVPVFVGVTLSKAHIFTFNLLSVQTVLLLLFLSKLNQHIDRLKVWGCYLEQWGYWIVRGDRKRSIGRYHRVEP